jgi:hypothetical protein
MNPYGIMETLDRLISTFVPPLRDMGVMLSQEVTLNIWGSNQLIPVSSAAILAYVLPWVDNLGAICAGLADFLDVL